MWYGIQTSPPAQFPDLRTYVDVVKRAEAAGYGFVTLPEHTIFPVGHEETMGKEWWDTLTLAGYLAASTSTIRLMFYVIVLPQHNPIYLAKQLATLDVLSEGRIDVGVGIGWLREEMEWLGSDFATRAARTEEYVEVMRTLWTTDPCNYSGRFVSFENASFSPKPAQQPTPPIWIGGGWKTSALRAARIGDGWMPMQATAEQFDEGLTLLHQELDRLGRPRTGFPVAARVPLFEPSPEATRHAVASGATKMEYFDGDHGRALEHVRESEAKGVTHLWLSVPAKWDRNLQEIETFGRSVIGVA